MIDAFEVGDIVLVKRFQILKKNGSAHDKIYDLSEPVHAIFLGYTRGNSGTAKVQQVDTDRRFYGKPWIVNTKELELVVEIGQVLSERSVLR